jgi:hypothetical protein
LGQETLSNTKGSSQLIGQTSSAINIEKFARYEFKYLLRAELFQRLVEEISHFMEYDGYVHPELNDSYFVRSLYFDDDLASNYYEKIDGVKVRRKFRIRTYEIKAAQETPIYLEEKGRTIERTYKRRTQIMADHLPLFYNPQINGEEILELYSGADLVESMVFNTLRKNLKPRVLVDYIRKPFISEYDAHFRVTFDTALKASSVRSLFPDDCANWIKAEAGYTILEVKFNRRIPSWFHKILQAYNMRRLSISKFCKGMEVCNLAQDLS